MSTTDVIALSKVKYITVDDVLNLIVEKLAPIQTVLNIKKSYIKEGRCVTERLAETDYDLLMDIFHEEKLLPDLQSEITEKEKNNFTIGDIRKYGLEHIPLPVKAVQQEKVDVFTHISGFKQDWKEAPTSEIFVPHVTEKYILMIRKYVFFMKSLHEIKKESWHVFQQAFDNAVNKPLWNLYVEFDSSRERNIRKDHLEMINSRIKTGDIKILNENRVFLKEVSLTTPIKIVDVKKYLISIGFILREAKIERIDDQKDALVTEIRRLADEISLERWQAGMQEITTRNISEAVSARLAKNRNNWGQKGPRSGDDIRKKLKGWRFIPPSEE